MHQTSSRLLRMTEDERPFTRDFKDLFSTLMVSLPLGTHRVRFSRIEHTFTTEEAMTNLGSLKFSQSNRMPDPKDLSRIVTTTTTTTFSMAKEMARSVCQRFLEARFIESVDGRTDFTSKNSVWQLTPKGMHILQRFCQRNGIHQKHVNELLDSPRNIMQLVILEREPETDKINYDSATVQVVFRRFAGDTGPNLSKQTHSSDSDSMTDYATGLVGVKMQKTRRGERDLPYMFSGKAAFDWLLDCCTTVDKREVFDLANLFLAHELMVQLDPDQRPVISNAVRFAASKQATYGITQKGLRVAGWVTSPNGSVNGEATAQQRLPNGVVRDSNTNRMTVIIRDPALRLLFREYLRETHCEENLAFYVEVKSFLSEYERAKRDTTSPRLDVIRETLASAYSLYNAFLAPGSPCELNIDHNLRNALATQLLEGLHIDFTAPIPTSQEPAPSHPPPQDMDLDPTSPPQPQPPDRPAGTPHLATTTPPSDPPLDWDPAPALTLSASQQDPASQHLTIREILDAVADDPSQSQITRLPVSQMTATQQARAFNDIVPAYSLTRFYSHYAPSALLPLLRAALHRLGVQTRDLPDATLGVRGLDARREPLHGTVRVERALVSTSSAVTTTTTVNVLEVRFIKLKGDPVGWRRLFKHVAVLCQEAIPRKSSQDPQVS